MQALPITISKDEIEKKARSKGGILGKLFVREPLFDVLLEYRKFFHVTLDYDVVAKKFPFKKHPVSGTLEIIVDAMHDTCCVKDKHEIFTLESVEGKEFQNGMHDMSEQQSLEYAQKYATRIIFRNCRSLPTFTKSTSSTFYRPFWMAYYGDPRAVIKPRYLPFDADGRAFTR